VGRGLRQDQRFDPVGSLGISRLGYPVESCPQLVLVFVTRLGRRGSFVVQGRALVGQGRPPERVDAGGDRLACGSLRGGQMALSRFGPLARRGRALIVLPRRLQLIQARINGTQAPPDLVPPAGPGLGLVGHATSMRPFNGCVAARIRFPFKANSRVIRAVG
jgi:hypothetical protein